jgi:hypothetical protein
LCPKCKKIHKHRIKDIDNSCEDLLNEFYNRFNLDKLEKNLVFGDLNVDEYCQPLLESSVLKIYEVLKEFSKNVFPDKKKEFLNNQENIKSLIKEFLFKEYLIY